MALAAAICAGCGWLSDRAAAAADARREDAYVRLLLALGERDRDSIDFYAGDPRWAAAARAEDLPLPEIKRRAASLLDETRRRAHARTNDRLSGDLAALIARVDLLIGRRFTFDEESRALFGVAIDDVVPPDGSQLEAVRQQIDALLPGTDALADRYAAFERRFLVPADRVPALLARAIAECRRITASHLPLPPGESVDLAYVHDQPWSAFTRYEGGGRSRTEVNLDFNFDVDRLLELACHETYPGHHAIDALTNPRAQAMFSPRTLRTEGAATFAVELAFPKDRRLAFERDVLLSLAGLGRDDFERYLQLRQLLDGLRRVPVEVARQYLDGRLDFVRAADVLEKAALMPRPAADEMIKFFNRFRTYAVAYTIGRDLAARAVDAAGAPGINDAARWRAYEAWIRQ